MSWTAVEGIAEYGAAFIRAEDAEVNRLEVLGPAAPPFAFREIECGILYHYVVGVRGDGVKYRDEWNYELTEFTLECSAEGSSEDARAECDECFCDDYPHLCPVATNTPRPVATNTPRPVATNTPRPVATNTPRPVATNTPRPVATNTPRPVATNTPRPDATNTPRPPKPTKTPTTRGRVGSSKSHISIGQTTEVYAYDVHPSDLEIKFRISGPISVEGNCPSQGSVNAETYYDVHSKFTAEGCAPGGKATVELRTKSNNRKLARSYIYVNTPTPTDPTPEPTAPPTPTNTPVTPEPTNTPVTPEPTNTPVTPKPTNTPVTPEPTNTPVTPKPTSTVTASLSPNPSKVNFRAVGDEWHEFTVSASEKVKVVANPGNSARRVEISSYRPGGTFCDAENNDWVTGGNGQEVYLSGCEAGTGTVQLWRKSNNKVIRTYTFSVGAPPTPIPPTPTDTPIPPTPTDTPVPPTPTDTPVPPMPTDTPIPSYAVDITKTLPGITSMYLEWNTSDWNEQNPPPANIKWCKKISFRPDPCSNIDVGKKTSYLFTGLEEDRGYDFRVSVNVGSGTSEDWRKSAEVVDNTHPAPTIGGIPYEVLETSAVRVSVKGTVTSHRFALESQSKTQLQTGKKCVRGLSPTPTPVWKGGQSPAFDVSRCGVGDEGPILAVMVRDATPIPASGSNSETEYFRWTEHQAWHQIDNTVAYEIEATPTPDPSATPMPSVTDATETAAGIWNDAGLGINYCEYPCAGGSVLDKHKTTIKVVDKISMNGCESAVACWMGGSGSALPNLGGGEIQIENPPIEGQSYSKTWTNIKSEARLDPWRRFYLPVYIAHELGHAAMGTRHQPSGRHLMLSPNSVIGEDAPGRTPIPELPGLMSDDDREAMKSIYKNHTAHKDDH